LKDLVAKLRDDLQAAMDEGADKGIKFKLETIELELKVVAKQTGEGKTGVKFWIANADVSGKIENEHTQTIKLKLVPQRAEAKPDGSRELELAGGVDCVPR
jgi:hypothetical protein